MKPTLWQQIRYRFGLFSRKDIVDTGEIAFGLGFEEGKKQGYNEAINQLPKVLADIAEERLRKVLEGNGKRNIS